MHFLLFFLMGDNVRMFVTICRQLRCLRVSLVGLLVFLSTFGCDGGQGNGVGVTEGDISTPVAAES